MRKISFLIILLILGGCSSLMMSVKDRDDANRHIVLKGGDEVSVLMPAIREKLIPKIKDAGWTGEGFAAAIQNEIVTELNRRKVKAKPDSSKAGNFLMIHIDDFSPGSGAARALGITGLGLAESKLEGTAIISTTAGKRELELKKRGQKSGVSETGDQTSDNIHYFASALASRICAGSK